MASFADNRRGVAAMLAGSAAFVANDACVRLAAANLPTGEIMALRGFGAMALIGLYAAATVGPRVLLRATGALVLMRGTAECLIAIAYITALPLIPFASLTAVLLAASLVTTGLAALLGFERVGLRRWSALTVGFAGVLIILRPEPAGIAWPAALAAASTLLVAVRDLITRRMRDDTPTIAIAFVMTGLVAVVGVGLGVVERNWRPPDRFDWTILAAAAAFVAVGNFMTIAAFRNIDIGVVAPFRYASLVYAVLLGLLIWGERPDAWTLGGAALIVGSGVYTIWRERALAKAARAAGPPA